MSTAPIPSPQSRLARRFRSILLTAFLAAALFAQGCTVEDYLAFLMGADIQEDFVANEYSLVWNQLVAKNFELDCAITNVGLWVSPVGGAPLPSQVTFAYSLIDYETEERTDTLLLLRRQGAQNYYYGFRDNRAGNPAGSCPQRVFTTNDQFGFFLKPSRRIPAGSRLDVEFAVRPVVELEECHAKIVATRAVVNKAQWIKRPGKSTAKPVAVSAGHGVEVHCQQTSDGQQGTLRVIYTDGTREIIGITCND